MKDNKQVKNSVSTNADLMDILKGLNKNTESDENCGKCDCGCGDEDNDCDDIGFPCILDTFPKYDFEKFQTGVNNMSELCGKITALQNVGLSALEAVKTLNDRETIDLEIEAIKISAKASIEVSKNTSVSIDKQQI